MSRHRDRHKIGLRLGDLTDPSFIGEYPSRIAKATGSSSRLTRQLQIDVCGSRIPFSRGLLARVREVLRRPSFWGRLRVYSLPG